MWLHPIGTSSTGLSGEKPDVCVCVCVNQGSGESLWQKYGERQVNLKARMIELCVAWDRQQV